MTAPTQTSASAASAAVASSTVSGASASAAATVASSPAGAASGAMGVVASASAATVVERPLTHFRTLPVSVKVNGEIVGPTDVPAGLDRKSVV